MRVKKGMTIDEVRSVWRSRAEAKSNAIMDSYYAQRTGGGGREGLGIYGSYKERASREKVRLAVKLLLQAGLEVSYQSIRKVTGQSTDTIVHYWSPPRQEVRAEANTEVDDDGVKIIRFPGIQESD